MNKISPDIVAKGLNKKNKNKNKKMVHNAIVSEIKNNHWYLHARKMSLLPYYNKSCDIVTCHTKPRITQDDISTMLDFFYFYKL